MKNLNLYINSNNIIIISLLLLLLFIVIICFYVYYKNKNNLKYNNKFNQNNVNNITILNLVLFSNSEHYDKMYEITSKYYKSLKNVKTIYYTFVEHISSPYLFIDDILYIKGKETYVPGILDKTIKAFSLVYQNLNIDHYDYIVRTNISTIANFDMLRNYLLLNKIEYGGSLLTLGWIDEKAGVVDKTYWGLDYAAGIAIIFSKDLFKKIMSDILYNKKKMNYSLIDDVAIGLFIKNNYPNIKLCNTKHIQVENSPYHPDTVFYRNKNKNRRDDIINMNNIVNRLLVSKNK